MSIKSGIKRVARSIWSWLVAAALAVAAFFGYEADSAAPPTTDIVSWTMPAQYVGGAALPLADIAKTTVVWGTVPGGPYSNSQDVMAPATSVTLARAGDGTGTRCYKAAVTTTAARGSMSSQYTDEVCKTVHAPPSAPTGLTVQ